MQQEIKINTLLRLKSFDISIGREITEVAIISKYNGQFCKLTQKKRSKKLAKARKEFRLYINSNETFTFSFMPPEETQKLINILNK